MDLNGYIETFSKLGNELIELSQNLANLSSRQAGKSYNNLIQKALVQNRWFTEDSIKMAMASIGTSLKKKNLIKWLKSYDIKTPFYSKTVGIIMAGNIPLVGFHDMLCTLISGHSVIAKLSSKDQFLYELVKNIIINIDPSFEKRITLTDETIKNVDAIIATGSDNSARYFEYYFSKYPHIIRKNRNSVAIITGDETFEELEELSNDIFTYFGLGCRNVSFLMIPENYNFDLIFKSFEKYNSVANHNKYANNYNYQKTIMMMNKIPMFDNGFVLLKEDSALSSPIGVVNYNYYNSKKDAEKFIEDSKHKIQCIVSKTNWSFRTFGLGKAQQPDLWDYADNIDTMNFLINLK